jgi:hypothetical protein
MNTIIRDELFHDEPLDELPPPSPTESEKRRERIQAQLREVFGKDGILWQRKREL